MNTTSAWPYFLEKQRIFEEKKKQEVIEQARSESEVLRKLEGERLQEKSWNNTLFSLWYAADKVLSALEFMRDTHVPDDNAPADDVFCTAVIRIPYVKQICSDLFFAWQNIDRHEFCKWI